MTQDNNVKQLQTQTLTNQQACVMVLEKALENAKAGRFAAVAIAAVWDTRTAAVPPMWSSCDCVPALIGAVGMLHASMIDGAMKLAHPMGKG